MKIKHISLAIAATLLLNLASLYAAWIDYEPQTIVQPNGQLIECFATGDEFHNWLHDQNGYTIIQNQDDGYYYYAALDNGDLVSSQWVVNQVNPAEKGLTPWTNISPDEMLNRRNTFMELHMPARPQLPGFASPESIQNEGTLNNIVVYIRFSDQSEFSTDTTFYHNMFNNSNSGHSSMLNYFEEVSYGAISIPSWFYPMPEDATVISYQDTYPRSYFMPYNSVTNPNGYTDGQTAEREHGLLKRACEFIEDEVPTTLNLDKNNDGYIDNMVFTIRGATTAWSTLLWPHRWALYSENVYIHGKKAWDYNLQVEDHLNGQGTGVLCHEMFHSLSAPDLYHYSSANYTSVGPWDLMDNNANPPQSMGAYMKYRYGGWIESIPEITECGTYTINPLSEEEDNCYKIASPNSSSQYYVLEYRRKEGTFEGGLPGSGLLVYRIDNGQNGNGNAQGPPDEVYLYRPNGTIYNNGTITQAHYAADYNRTEINDNTNPDPFLQNGQPGGLNIANIGFIGESISFEVFFEQEPTADFSASQILATPGCEIDFFDESACEVNSWNWTFEGGSPGSSTEQHPTGITWDTPGTYTITLEATNDWGSNSKVKNAYIEISEDALPEIEFFASDSVVCTNQIISLQDFSTVCPTAWEWEINPSTFSFANGTNASSQHVDIILNSPETYTVSLTVTNDNGSSTVLKEEYLEAGGAALPFTEDFENGNLSDRGWVIENPDEEITWEPFVVSGNNGEMAAGINLFNYFSIFERDRLISPPLNLSTTDQAYLMFDHAYAQSLNTAYTDSLIVKISTDCGESWTRIAELGEDGSMNFATHFPSEYNFIPLTSDDWCGTVVNASCNTINISPWTGSPDVRILFESVRLTGNNLFIDNVTVSVTTSMEADSKIDERIISVFPNPTSGSATVKLYEDHLFDVLSLFNSQGMEVYRHNISADTRQISLEMKKYPKGLYFISCQGELGKQITKLVIQ